MHHSHRAVFLYPIGYECNIIAGNYTPSGISGNAIFYWCFDVFSYLL